MEAKCKKCGKPLRDPVSIARGMGPSCAGIATNRKSFSSSSKLRQGRTYPVVEENLVSVNLVSCVENSQSRIPKVLNVYPSDLVDLVLSAPQPGSIATWVKKYSCRKKNKLQPIRILKQIRRTCIEQRLLFWPGLSMNLAPIPCIPHGDDGWKIGENGRVINKAELVAYLARYGIIAQNQLEPTLIWNRT